MKYKILTAVWVLVIFLTMTTPGLGGRGIPFLPEMIHFVEFFVLGVLLVKSFDKPYFLGGGLLYAILIESVQLSVSGRIFSFTDMVINIVGLCMGFFLLKYMQMK